MSQFPPMSPGGSRPPAGARHNVLDVCDPVLVPAVLDVSAGALDRVVDTLRERSIAPHARLLVIASAGSGRALRPMVPALGALPWRHVTEYSARAADRLSRCAVPSGLEAVIGLGGGRLLDVAKFVASDLGLPCVACPTSLSQDGIISPVSTLPDGAHRRSRVVSPPAGVIVDLRVVRRAPARLSRAGAGDVLSNLSAVADWELSGRATGERIDERAVALARAAGSRLRDAPEERSADEFHRTLAEALLLSGAAMIAARSTRPCSGACHKIARVVDRLPGRPVSLHGEQVALGAAFATFLRDGMGAAVGFAAALRRYRLPVHPGQLGMSARRFGLAAWQASRTRTRRFTILEQLSLDALSMEEAVMEYLRTLREQLPYGPPLTVAGQEAGDPWQ